MAGMAPVDFIAIGLAAAVGPPVAGAGAIFGCFGCIANSIDWRSLAYSSDPM